MDPEVPLFEEAQRFRQWWLWLTVLFVAGIGWAGFWQQIVLGEPFGDQPTSDAVIWVVFLLAGLALPVGFGLLRLRTVVRPGRVEVAFPPFPVRRVDLDDVLSIDAVDYRPVAHYGGWGYRRTLSGGTAFTVRGHRGVRLGLAGDRHLLIGSQRADELATVLAAARLHR